MPSSVRPMSGRSAMLNDLGSVGKPCLLINTAGYWDGLVEFLEAVKAGFVKPRNRGLLCVVAGTPDAMECIAAHLA